MWDAPHYSKEPYKGCSGVLQNRVLWYENLGLSYCLYLLIYVLGGEKATCTPPFLSDFLHIRPFKKWFQVSVLKRICSTVFIPLRVTVIDSNNDTNNHVIPWYHEDMILSETVIKPWKSHAVLTLNHTANFSLLILLRTELCLTIIHSLLFVFKVFVDQFFYLFFFF